MKAPAINPDREPVGIVISMGSIHAEPTVFSAYVWGPAPTKATPTKAA